jgi:hypothetical protein
LTLSEEVLSNDREFSGTLPPSGCEACVAGWRASLVVSHHFREHAVYLFIAGDLDDGIWNEVTGIYPSFQDIEISGNTIQSATGTGICLTGTRNDHIDIDNDQFTECAAVPDADPIYSYFGSESRSALVLSFADNVLATGDVVIGNPICTAQTDSASRRNVAVGQ